MRKYLVNTLVVIALIAAACNPGPRAESGSDTTGGSASSAVSVEEAQTAANGYFDAFNSGDTNAVLTWFPSNAEFSDNFTGSIPRESWEQRLAWNMAQGTTLDNPDCVATDGDANGNRTVTCESGTRNAQIQAVGARPVSTLVTLLVTPNGIETLNEEFGQPDFLLATQPFMEWMASENPEDASKVGFDVWDSVDQAEVNGKLTADYSRQWAAYLELTCIYIPDLIEPESDSYLDDCGFIGR